MSSTRPTNPALRAFAWLTALATVGLIAMGGLVTSHGVGMAVPDWPTSFGYNMFALPWSHWFGNFGVFYEHSHRVYASVIGLLTTILAVWIWAKDSRRWMRWLGVIAFVVVSLQGLLGGLRVRLSLPDLGIFHAALAQIFLLLLVVIAFCLSRSWQAVVQQRGQIRFHPFLRPLLVGSTVVIFVQLLIGATMRHQHAGLAVPDFPLAYGQLWPRTDEAFLHEINSRRLDARDYEPITAGQIHLHMAHRATAILILGLLVACVLAGRRGQTPTRVQRFIDGWCLLIVLQAGMGAYTVLSNKAADIATAHVVLGAISLSWGGLLSIAASALSAPARAGNRLEVAAGSAVLTS